MQLASLYGSGGGRIPLADGSSITFSRNDLAACLAAMSTAESRSLHLAVRQGDLATAQRLLREAAIAYQTAAAAPAVAPAPLPRSLRRTRVRVS